MLFRQVNLLIPGTVRRVQKNTQYQQATPLDCHTGFLCLSVLQQLVREKGVSHLLGHAKEIISVDVYGDTQEIIEDCLDLLEPFIEEVIPKERKDQYYDYSEVIEIDLILEEYFNAA